MYIPPWIWNIDRKGSRMKSATFVTSSNGMTDKGMSKCNGTTTVIDIDDRQHGQQQQHRGNGFLLNGGLPNGVNTGRSSQVNGVIPESAIKKIAIEIAEASAAQAAQPPKLPPEPFKTLLTAVFCMFVSYLSAFTMTYTHDRTPDLTSAPPLPDLVFDLVPRVKWAFLACEIGMMVMVTANLVNLALHKHRLIVARRFLFTLFIAYFMRCLTMIVTSLSLTGYHVHCGKKMSDSVWSRLGRAVVPSIGLGMTVTGQRDDVCGDYMYSGHTVSIMSLCLFFTEYTPRRCRLLHLIMWLIAGASLFFIVAAHEHYTVDVLIGMIVTSLIFLYYHALANTRAHLHRDVNRVRVWIPLFYYMEANVDGVVPNDYEWPFRCPSISWPRCPKLWYRSKSGLVD